MYKSIHQNNLANELCKATINRMHELYGESLQIKRGIQLGNNGELLDGISIFSAEERFASTIYLNSYVDKILNGESFFDDVVDEISNCYMWKNRNDTEASLLDTENVREKLYCVVVNKEQNKEMLVHAAHVNIPQTDLALVARIEVKVDDNGKISALVKKRALGYLQMTEQELMDIAILNTKQNEKWVIFPMEEVLLDVGVPQKMLEEEQYPRGYVVTNESGYNGSTQIFVDASARQKVRDLIGGDYFIIPSSIHEVICYSAKNTDAGTLKRMIQDVNSTLKLDEVLSDKPYLVNEKLQMSIPTELIEETENINEIKLSIGAHI